LIIDRIIRFLKREPLSKEVAKNRLKLVIIQDRLGVEPDIVDVLKDEIIGVLTKYFEIDTDQVDVSLHREEGSVALVASIPILSMKERLRGKAAQNR